MKHYLILIILLLFAQQIVHSQEDGVVAFTLPIRNSLKFNRYIINPTFSFVREQNPYFSVYNKKQWTQIEEGPQTYLFSYSGRFRDNESIAVGVFQQNYGVLTTFGAVANFAHNVELQSDSNLTFGLNFGFYKSGLDESKVITNYPDPSLENIPSNSVLTINPGINYGTSFLDLGLSLNNLVLYNITTGGMVDDDPERSIQAHIMHTGFIESYGFFDQSKFSGILRTEFKKDKTIVSGLASFSLPIGVWVQAGYNSLYGISGGLGMNITKNISFEYNYETGTGDISNFGASHEFALAFKFKSKKYSYAYEEEEGSVIPAAETRAPVGVQQKALTVEEKAQKEQQTAEIKARRATIAQEKLAAAELAKNKAVTKPSVNNTAKPIVVPVAKSTTTAQSKAGADAKLAAENKIKSDSIAKAKLAADAKIKATAEAKLAAENKIKSDSIAKAKLAADAKIKADAEAKLAAEAKVKSDSIAKAKLAEDAKLAADAQAKLDAEAKVKSDSIAKAKLAEDAKLAAVVQAKLDADAALKAAALAKAQLAAAAKVKADSIVKPVILPKDEIAKSMDNVALSIEKATKDQQLLLTDLNKTVAAKQKELQDMKEENDLSEKGLVTEPKPFKSTAGETKALEDLNIKITTINKIQSDKIVELEGLYNQRIKKVSDKNDALNQYYLKTIALLKTEQVKAIQSNKDLVTSLEKIKVATEIEKKRRIKKAAFVNEDQRLTQDKAALMRIKETTPYSATPIKVDDFDFGLEQSNLQIVKGVKNVQSGFYLTIAVHSDIAKRDEFLTKTVASGGSNVEFFYDAKTSKYYIYSDKYDSIDEAKNALSKKVNMPYNAKMNIVKIEN